MVRLLSVHLSKLNEKTLNQVIFGMNLIAMWKLKISVGIKRKDKTIVGVLGF